MDCRSPTGRSLCSRTLDIVKNLAAAGSAHVGVVVLRGQTDTWSLSRAGVPRAGLVQGQFLGDGCEEVLDVLSGLCRGLEEEEAGLASISLSIGGRDGALLRLLGDQIQLVTRKGDDNVLVRLTLELLDPRLCLI